MKIEFHNHSEVSNLIEPIKANKMLPDWYKKLESYTNNKKTGSGSGETNGTIKKCVPVFDMITAGYLLLTPAEIMVTRDENNKPFFQWSTLDLIKWHPAEQAPTHPKNKINDNVPKINNYWGIQTPRGYSCLFISPQHRDTPIEILSGIVDTDTYFLPVHFPFALKEENWEGVIPAGTPYAQVIPFKRNKWVSLKKKANQKKTLKLVYTWNKHMFNRYKQEFWHKKEYL
jgi:hypothetical protein